MAIKFTIGKKVYNKICIFFFLLSLFLFPFVSVRHFGRGFFSLDSFFLFVHIEMKHAIFGRLSTGSRNHLLSPINFRKAYGNFSGTLCQNKMQNITYCRSFRRRNKILLCDINIHTVWTTSTDFSILDKFNPKMFFFFLSFYFWLIYKHSHCDPFTWSLSVFHSLFDATFFWRFVNHIIAQSIWENSVIKSEWGFIRSKQSF